MIQLSHVSKTLGSVLAINDVNVIFNEGIIGLVGHNGAGKSTLFRLISNVYKVDEGNILIDEKDVATIEAKGNLFYLSDDPYCPKYTTLKKLHVFYECFYNIDKEYLFDMYKKLDLPLDRNITSFSKGMKRQAFLCLALAINVDNLLLDEAFDGIDPLCMEILKKEMISKYSSENKTLVIASHNIETLQRLCDKFVILSSGRKVNEGNEEELSITFVKLQVVTKSLITVEYLDSLGINTISVNKVGSVYEVIIQEKENVDHIKIIEDEIKPLLLDEIPLSYSEIISLQMLVAKREDRLSE